MPGMREENRVTADEIKGKDREATVKYCVDKIFGGYEKRDRAGAPAVHAV